MEVELRTLSAIHAVDEVLGSLGRPAAILAPLLPSGSVFEWQPSLSRPCLASFTKGTQTFENATRMKGVQASPGTVSRYCQSVSSICHSIDVQTDNVAEVCLGAPVSETPTIECRNAETQTAQYTQLEEEVKSTRQSAEDLRQRLDSVMLDLGDCRLQQREQRIIAMCSELQSRELEQRFLLLQEECEFRVDFAQACFRDVLVALKNTDAREGKVPNESHTSDVSTPMKDIVDADEFSTLLRECQQVLYGD